MKKILLPTLALGLALAMTGCSDDLDVNGATGGNDASDDGNYAYIKATIALPTSSSRSSTDWYDDEDPDGPGQNPGDTPSDATPDHEYGYAYENDVRTVLLVIATTEDKYITHVTVEGLAATSEVGEDWKFATTAKIKHKVLEEAYGEGGVFAGVDAPQVRLYVYCNYTQNLKQQMDRYGETHQYRTYKDGKDVMETDETLTKWMDLYGSVEENASMAGQAPQETASIWSPRSFLMSNASVYEANFPAKLEDWDAYADSNKPLSLTRQNNNEVPIDVERVAARFDYRDGSPYFKDGKYDDPTKQYTYPIYVNNGADEVLDEAQAAAEENKLNLFSVKLERMILVNMSKYFYYLRRVSSNGLMTGKVEYCGRETRSNWIVDVDAAAKDADYINNENAGEFFNFPLFDENKNLIGGNLQYNNIGGKYGWYISNIKDVLAETNYKDNWPAKDQGTYRIWRYVTENTIPQPVEKQQVKQSTGIIFKAKIVAGENIDSINSRLQTPKPFVSKAVKDAFNHPDLGKSKKQTGNKIPEGMHPLYMFHNMLYAGVADIVRGAMEDGKNGPLYNAVAEILKQWVLDPETKKFEYHEALPADDEVVSLSVAIADEILNLTPVTDGSRDYGVGTEDTELDANGFPVRKSDLADDGTQPRKGDAVYTIDFKDVELNAQKGYDYEESHFIKLSPEMGITVYVPTDDDGEGWGYYCYYFYWNRHNDNNLNGKMGPMEFAVVRNNVYKLSVTKISSLGHPRDTDRDPDPLDPDDPDEDPLNSIRVAVHVMPWTVRVNDIEF